MTTAQSPLGVLKAQADKIAMNIKQIERGETVGDPRMHAQRDKPSFSFGVVMDDKIIKVEMTWAMIRNTSEVALAAYILRQMQESRLQ